MLKEIEETVPGFMELTGKSLEDATRIADKLSGILERVKLDGIRHARERKEVPGYDYFLEIARLIFGKPDPDAADILNHYFVEGYNSSWEVVTP